MQAQMKVGGNGGVNIRLQGVGLCLKGASHSMAVVKDISPQETRLVPLLRVWCRKF